MSTAVDQVPSVLLPATNGGMSNGGGERVFAHIDDLKADATTGYSHSQSVSQLFSIAERSLQQAQSNIEFRRPDLAFVEYLRAYEIAVQAIPKHKDYVHFMHDQHGDQKLNILRRRITAMDDRFDKIKEIIVNNNKRSGALPRNQRQQGETSNHARTTSESAMAASGAHKVKPSVSPKPEKLHARAIPSLNGSITSPGAESITDRFNKLRFGGQVDTARPGSRGSTSSVHSLVMPSATDFGGNANSQQGVTNGVRPSGPRDMPENGVAPGRPSALPLDTLLAAAMPTPPSPTYSPARNMQTTGNIAPPRHSARSLAGPSRKSSLIPTSSASYVAPNGTGDYFGSTGSTEPAPVPGQLPRRKSVHMPKETRITAERLYDYSERFDIMLIDFRPRDDFDQGHIYTRNVMCIEPTLLSQGMSAEQLADRLVISPEDEQVLFNTRDKFDLVVYYDNDTQSESYLSQPRGEAQTQLKYLHEALYDFNQDKPLLRPPILLVGGIEAWINLLGRQALQSTNTQTRIKTGRPLQRRVMARDGQIKLPKRRLRDYNPLDAEEEKKWRDRAQSESMPEAPVPHESDEEEESDALQKFPNIDEFNARFPEAGALGQQSGIQISSRDTPPPRPVSIPQYPATPAHSVYPPPPARPAPAAPRMSYTGVSDRAVSHTTPTTRSSSQLLPYIPQRFLSKNMRIPKTGIQNFGNTCYMNATLQALSATTPLTILVLDDGYKKLVQKDNWKGSRGLLPEIYANTVRSLWEGKYDYIKPTTLLGFCARLNSTFKDPNQQQDAQEFFSFIVDCLHEDFNGQWAKQPLRMLTEHEEAKRERMPKLVVAKTEWGRYIHRENSFLTSLFYGQHSSRLKCPKCSFTSTTYEAWALLQVEIPECREVKLQECLRQHFKDELLDDENQWTCPSCKVPRRATKKLTMTRAPPFLVVALKRFKQNARGDQRKIHTAVRFPLQGLDMEEFVLPPPSPEEAVQIATNYGADHLKTDVTLTPPYMYDAYAVVRHLGDTTRSGHYTCAVKDKARDCWRYFNDTRHSDFHPESVGAGQALDNDQAYLVFYQRRNTNEPNGAAK